MSIRQIREMMRSIEEEHMRNPGSDEVLKTLEALTYGLGFRGQLLIEFVPENERFRHEKNPGITIGSPYNWDDR